MLVTVSALIIAATMSALGQSGAGTEASNAPTPMRSSRLVVSRSDSIRALRLAHRAQGDFEWLRRRLLPQATLVGAGGCDALVGSYCYLNQVRSAAPEEAPEVVVARARFLTILDTL